MSSRMERRLILTTALLFLSMRLFMSAEESRFAAQAGCTSLYADGKDNSFLYGASLKITDPILFADKLHTSLSAFFGTVPDELSVTISGAKIYQRNIAFAGAGFSLGYDFTPSTKLTVSAATGTETTASGDLYLVKATITFPFFASMGTRLSLPHSVFVSAETRYADTRLSTNSGEFGQGSMWQWNAAAGKGFEWDSRRALRTGTGNAAPRNSRLCVFSLCVFSC